MFFEEVDLVSRQSDTGPQEISQVKYNSFSRTPSPKIIGQIGFKDTKSREKNYSGEIQGHQVQRKSGTGEIQGHQVQRKELFSKKFRYQIWFAEKSCSSQNIFKSFLA